MGGGAGVKIGTPSFSIGGFVDYAMSLSYGYLHMYFFEKFSFLYFSASYIIMILIKIVLDILVSF